MRTSVISLLTPVENGDTYTFHDLELENILLDPAIRDKKVAILSVAGAMRKGKSFLLNIFIRYLSAFENGEPPVRDDWLLNPLSMDGFSWRGGRQRDTTGILLFNRPFFVKDPDGEEFVVFLMDTQGCFDHATTMRGCATIFGLSTLVSSMQIYNLTGQIQENDLQNLQLFTQYGRLALEGNRDKPLQSLLFLVRDWTLDAELGFEAGREYLSEVLTATRTQHQDLRELRRDIRDSFSSTSCFLLPHPGLEVATRIDPNGDLPQLEESFRDQVCDLTRRIFSGDHLAPKTINDEPIDCASLFQHFRAYVKVFMGDEIPTPASLLKATADTFNDEVVHKAMLIYEGTVHDCQVLLNDGAPVHNLQEIHDEAKRRAINYFEEKRMGTESVAEPFTDKLRKLIEIANEAIESENARNRQRASLRKAVVVVITTTVQTAMALGLLAFKLRGGGSFLRILM